VVDEARDACSAASHIAAVVTEAAWGALKAAPKRVTVPDVAIPYSPPLEKALLPDPERIAAAVRATLGR
jgi:pyruvate dehydrogenase E1 component beta subunit